ncbi:MAG: hypothetical protein HN404_12005 [Gemmatimonadetes bacterium]|nr:hypothetical protein [Gemmatimonadota bacterium]
MMEYREFGQTGMHLSAVGLGGLLAKYEAVFGRPPAEEKQRIYRRAAELGVNLFDTGYGDEVDIPDEMRGPGGDHFFSLKAGVANAADLKDLVDKHLANLRRDTIDILRVHHRDYVGVPEIPDTIASLRQAGKVRSLCLIRHYEDDQRAYADTGPEADADADLVIYNYVCRHQEPGLQQAAAAGKGVLIMKALGGQWLDWSRQTQTDWSQATQATILELSPEGDQLRDNLGLIYPIVSGPWQELSGAGQSYPSPSRAVQWVLENDAVSSCLVSVASLDELEETVGSLWP